MQAALLAASVPFNTRRSNFWRSRHVQGVVGLLAFLLRPHDDAAFVAAIEVLHETPPSSRTSASASTAAAASTATAAASTAAAASTTAIAAPSSASSAPAQLSESQRARMEASKAAGTARREPLPTPN